LQDLGFQGVLLPVPAIDSNLLCPSCSSSLRPVQLACASCGITVEGPFQLNEFATLAPDDLHFLRIFVRSEGRIRDMEAALGLSYPTIRTRLSALKTKLQGADAGSPPEPTKPDPEAQIQAILAELQQKRISFDQAMAQIKRLRGESGEAAP
jgi:hypothetical protein